MAQAPRAFGHYGYGGSGGWADPDLSLSLGFVTNNTCASVYRYPGSKTDGHSGASY